MEWKSGIICAVSAFFLQTYEETGPTFLQIHIRALYLKERFFFSFAANSNRSDALCSGLGISLLLPFCTVVCLVIGAALKCQSPCPGVKPSVVGMSGRIYFPAEAKHYFHSCPSTTFHSCWRIAWHVHQGSFFFITAPATLRGQGPQSAQSKESLAEAGIAGVVHCHWGSLRAGITCFHKALQTRAAGPN